MKIDSLTPVQDLLSIAINTLSEIDKNEEFIVKDLFRTFEWNRIDRGNRTRLGSQFFSYSQNKGSSIILPTSKTPQNQQKYIKK